LKKKLKKVKNKKHLSKLKLTCQTCNPYHVIEITHRKHIETNYKTQFLINPMLKDDIAKKSIRKGLKKHKPSQLGFGLNL
jgi:hypothetical protein